MSTGPAVVVVLYDPSPADLTRLARTAALARRLVVVDNTPVAVAGLEDLVGAGASVVHNANRGGLAGAYNVAARTALAEPGCTGFLLLDQDSDVGADFVPSLVAHSSALAGTAHLVGPSVHEAATGAPMLNHPPPLGAGAAAEVEGLRPVEFVISSGCLVSAEAYAAIGPFAEDLVIESVDIEYCLRGWSRGVPTYLDPGTRLEQRTGSLRAAGTGWALDYSPTRQYYRVRNYYWTLHRYLPWWPARRRATRFALQQLWLVLRRERDRRAKVVAILEGVRDALTGRLGPRRR